MMIATGVSASSVASAASTRDGGLATFLPLRRRLFAIAYRMLGRALEAEDVVQDVWIRWQTTDRSVVRNPTAFLVAATTRLAINLRKSARVRLEKDIGPRRPEPVDTSSAASLTTDRREAVRTGVLVLLQRLSPAERAAYVLREAFEYSYHEIAGLLSTTVVNARQLVNRARMHVLGSRRAPVRLTDQCRLIDAFMAASISGDLAGLESVLAADASSHLHRRMSVSHTSVPAGPVDRRGMRPQRHERGPRS
jgi:RNA polymerase sigma-70 factor (ECF subfamily)